MAAVSQSRRDQVIYQLRAEFMEMPGLSLTAVQIRRLLGLFDLTVDACEGIFDAAVADGLLMRTEDGRYRARQDNAG